MACHHDYRQPDSVLSKPALKFKAVHVGHPDIRDDTAVLHAGQSGEEGDS